MTESASPLGTTAFTALLASAEQAINAGLRYDPGTRAQLHRLEHKTLALKLTQPHCQITITALDGRVRLGSYVEAPQAQVLGSLPDALAWLASGDSLANHQLEVRGNTALLLDWQQLVGNLDIDWEDLINPLLGDVVGHAVASHLRGLWRWGHARRHNMADQLVEFSVEERQWLPNRALFNDFRQRNQSLRLDIDRLQARVTRLQTLISEASE